VRPSPTVLLLTIIVVLFVIPYLFDKSVFAINFDNANACRTDGATTCAITIGSHPNGVLIAQFDFGRTPSTGYDPTSVSIGSYQFTKLTTVEGDGTVFAHYTSVWYLTSSAGLATGPQTVTVVWGQSPSYSVISLISLYNVNQAMPLVNSITEGGHTIDPTTITVTPTHAGSWIVAEGGAQYGLGNPNQQAFFTNISDFAGDFAVSAQYNPSPTINAGNLFSWSSTTTAGFAQSVIGYEVLPSSGISFDTSSTCNSSSSNCSSVTLTIGNNTNRLLIAQIATGITTPNVSGVAIGSIQFKHANLVCTSGGYITCTDIWYLINPPIGSQTVTATLSGVSYYGLGVISLYNVDQTSGISSTTNRTNTGTGGTATINITPQTTGSWIFGFADNNGYGENTPSNIDIYHDVQVANGGATYYAAQLNANPVINSSNTLTFCNSTTLGSCTPVNDGWNMEAIEVLPFSTNHNYFESISDMINSTEMISFIHTVPPTITYSLIALSNGGIASISECYTADHSSSTFVANQTLMNATHFVSNYIFNQQIGPLNASTICPHTFMENFNTFENFSVATKFIGTFINGNANPYKIFTAINTCPTGNSCNVNQQVSWQSKRSNDFTKMFIEINKMIKPFSGSCLVSNNTFGQNSRNYTWSNVMFENLTVSVPFNQQVYYYCVSKDPFSFSGFSSGNQTGGMAGVATVFKNSLGAMIGVPAGTFVLVLIASLANARTGPIYVIITLGFAGIVSTIGLLTLSTGFWALSLIAGMLGLLVGRKIF